MLKRIKHSSHGTNSQHQSLDKPSKIPSHRIPRQRFKDIYREVAPANTLRRRIALRFSCPSVNHFLTDHQCIIIEQYKLHTL